MKIYKYTNAHMCTYAGMHQWKLGEKQTIEKPWLDYLCSNAWFHCYGSIEQAAFFSDLHITPPYKALFFRGEGSGDSLKDYDKFGFREMVLQEKIEPLVLTGTQQLLIALEYLEAWIAYKGCIKLNLDDKQDVLARCVEQFRSFAEYPYESWRLSTSGDADLARQYTAYILSFAKHNSIHYRVCPSSIRELNLRVGYTRDGNILHILPFKKAIAAAKLRPAWSNTRISVTTY